MASTDEQRSREVAEKARERAWRGESFLRDLFLGTFRLDLVHPFPDEEPDRPQFREFRARLKGVLNDHVDSVEIDETGEYPRALIDALADIGAFGMKIPEAYGGLGLTHPEYVRAMELLGSADGNVTALLSAHQAIGVPQPIKLFGTEEQKRRFLPRCARGAISAFALTEPAVGSDPARLSTIVRPSADGQTFTLNGTKLWCTNGTLADLIVVMARNPATDRISAFVVEMDWPGVNVDHRSRFMGLKALANAQISFDDVEIPRDHLIGNEGDGLKIALSTLNTGRLSLPAATAGAAKQTLEIVRTWSRAREQWGVPIGKHEVIAHKIADTAANAFAMESLAHLVGDLADRPNTDIRLEAAAAKEWNTVTCWRMLDDALQIRGGRGYETERSLEDRGEPPVGIERALRDARINLIFEGSSEIMHLFMAREAVDKHLQVAGALVNPKTSGADKLRALPAIAAFYARWYPLTWIGWGRYPRYSEFGRLARHLRFAERATRRLARSLFHGMLVYRAGLERKQAFLFRAVDIGMELLALTASVSRAHAIRQRDADITDSAVDLADAFARASRRRIQRLFREMWRNDDAAKYLLGRSVFEGRHLWLEQGAAGIGYGEDDLRPPTIEEIAARRRAREEPQREQPAASPTGTDARTAG